MIVTFVDQFKLLEQPESRIFWRVLHINIFWYCFYFNMISCYQYISFNNNRSMENVNICDSNLNNIQKSQPYIFFTFCHIWSYLIWKFVTFCPIITWLLVTFGHILIWKLVTFCPIVIWKLVTFCPIWSYCNLKIRYILSYSNMTFSHIQSYLVLL